MRAQSPHTGSPQRAVHSVEPYECQYSEADNDLKIQCLCVSYVILKDNVGNVQNNDMLISLWASVTQHV